MGAWWPPSWRASTACPAPGRATVARPRLMAGLVAADLPPLTVVAAPAGFGKTTLLAEWLAALPPDEAVGRLALAGRGRQRPRRCSWPTSSARSARPRDVVGAGALQQLSASLAVDRGGARHRWSTTSTGCRRSSCSSSTTTTSSRHREVHEAMTFLLEHQPPELHLVLATRADPPLPLARMRARGQLREVRAADLRFTVEEAAAYLNGSMGLALSDARRRGARRPHRGLDRRPAAGRAVDAGSRRTPARSSPASRATTGTSSTTSPRRSWPASLTTYATSCCETSVLERLSGPALRRRHRAGRRHGRRSSRSSGPTSSSCRSTTGASGTATTTCSPTSCARTCASCTRTGSAELHRRASAWFEAEGDTSQAISHALAAGDTARAADLMELGHAADGPGAAGGRAGPLAARAARRRGAGRGRCSRSRSSGRWPRCRTSPPSVTGCRPSSGRCAADDGSWPETPPPGLRGRRRGRLPVAPRRHRDVPGRAGAARTATWTAPSGTPARRWPWRPPDDDLVRAGAGALGGLASWATGDLASAHAAYTESVAGLRQHRLRRRRPGLQHHPRRHLPDAGPARRRAAHLPSRPSTWRRRPSAEPVRGPPTCTSGRPSVLLERDDLAGAAEHLAASQALGEHHVAAAERLPVAGRRRPAARGRGRPRRRAGRCSTRRSGSTTATTRRTCGRCRRCGPGCGSGAASWPRPRRGRRSGGSRRPTSCPTCASTSTSPSPGCCSPGTSGRGDATALLRGPRPARAPARCSRGRRAQTAPSSSSSCCRPWRTTPAATYRAALVALGRAVTLAEPEGYLRVFADEGPPMASLLRALARQSTSGAYVRRLLAATAA